MKTVKFVKFQNKSFIGNFRFFASKKKNIANFFKKRNEQFVAESRRAREWALEGKKVKKSRKDRWSDKIIQKQSWRIHLKSDWVNNFNGEIIQIFWVYFDSKMLTHLIRLRSVLQWKRVKSFHTIKCFNFLRSCYEAHMTNLLLKTVETFRSPNFFFQYKTSPLNSIFCFFFCFPRQQQKPKPFKLLIEDPLKVEVKNESKTMAAKKGFVGAKRIKSKD